MATATAVVGVLGLLGTGSAAAVGYSTTQTAKKEATAANAGKQAAEQEKAVAEHAKREADEEREVVSRAYDDVHLQLQDAGVVIPTLSEAKDRTAVVLPSAGQLGEEDDAVFCERYTPGEAEWALRHAVPLYDDTGCSEPPDDICEKAESCQAGSELADFCEPGHDRSNPCVRKTAAGSCNTFNAGTQPGASTRDKQVKCRQQGCVFKPRSSTIETCDAVNTLFSATADPSDVARLCSGDLHSVDAGAVHCGTSWDPADAVPGSGVDCVTANLQEMLAKVRKTTCDGATCSPTSGADKAILEETATTFVNRLLDGKTLSNDRGAIVDISDAINANDGSLRVCADGATGTDSHLPMSAREIVTVLAGEGGADIGLIQLVQNCAAGNVTQIPAVAACQPQWEACVAAGICLEAGAGVWSLSPHHAADAPGADTWQGVKACLAADGTFTAQATQQCGVVQEDGAAAAPDGAFCEYNPVSLICDSPAAAAKWESVIELLSQAVCEPHAQSPPVYNQCVADFKVDAVSAGAEKACHAAKAAEGACGDEWDPNDARKCRAPANWGGVDVAHGGYYGVQDLTQLENLAEQKFGGLRVCAGYNSAQPPAADTCAAVSAEDLTDIAAGGRTDDIGRDACVQQDANEQVCVQWHEGFGVDLASTGTSRECFAVAEAAGEQFANAVATGASKLMCAEYQSAADGGGIASAQVQNERDCIAIDAGDFQHFEADYMEANREFCIQSTDDNRKICELPSEVGDWDATGLSSEACYAITADNVGRYACAVPLSDQGHWPNGSFCAPTGTCTTAETTISQTVINGQSRGQRFLPCPRQAGGVSQTCKAWEDDGALAGEWSNGLWSSGVSGEINEDMCALGSTSWDDIYMSLPLVTGYDVASYRDASVTGDAYEHHNYRHMLEQRVGYGWEQPGGESLAMGKSCGTFSSEITNLIGDDLGAVVPEDGDRCYRLSREVGHNLRNVSPTLGTDDGLCAVDDRHVDTWSDDEFVQRSVLCNVLGSDVRTCSRAAMVPNKMPASLDHAMICLAQDTADYSAAAECYNAKADADGGAGAACGNFAGCVAAESADDVVRAIKEHAKFCATADPGSAGCVTPTEPVCRFVEKPHRDMKMCSTSTEVPRGASPYNSGQSVWNSAGEVWDRPEGTGQGTTWDNAPGAGGCDGSSALSLDVTDGTSYTWGGEAVPKGASAFGAWLFGVDPPNASGGLGTNMAWARRALLLEDKGAEQTAIIDTVGGSSVDGAGGLQDYGPGEAYDIDPNTPMPAGEDEMRRQFGLDPSTAGWQQYVNETLASQEPEVKQNWSKPGGDRGVPIQFQASTSGDKYRCVTEQSPYIDAEGCWMFAAKDEAWRESAFDDSDLASITAACEAFTPLQNNAKPCKFVRVGGETNDVCIPAEKMQMAPLEAVGGLANYVPGGTAEVGDLCAAVGAGADSSACATAQGAGGRDCVFNPHTRLCDNRACGIQSRWMEDGDGGFCVNESGRRTAADVCVAGDDVYADARAQEGEVRPNGCEFDRTRSDGCTAAENWLTTQPLAIEPTQDVIDWHGARCIDDRSGEDLAPKYGDDVLKSNDDTNCVVSPICMDASGSVVPMEAIFDDYLLNGTRLAESDEANADAVRAELVDALEETVTEETFAAASNHQRDLTAACEGRYALAIETHALSPPEGRTIRDGAGEHMCRSKHPASYRCYPDGDDEQKCLSINVDNCKAAGGMPSAVPTGEHSRDDYWRTSVFQGSGPVDTRPPGFMTKQWFDDNNIQCVMTGKKDGSSELRNNDFIRGMALCHARTKTIPAGTDVKTQCEAVPSTGEGEDIECGMIDELITPSSYFSSDATCMPYTQPDGCADVNCDADPTNKCCECTVYGTTPEQEQQMCESSSKCALAVGGKDVPIPRGVFAGTFGKCDNDTSPTFKACKTAGSNWKANFGEYVTVRAVAQEAQVGEVLQAVRKGNSTATCTALDQGDADAAASCQGAITHGAANVHTDSERCASMKRCTAGTSKCHLRHKKTGVILTETNSDLHGLFPADAPRSKAACEATQGECSSASDGNYDCLETDGAVLPVTTCGEFEGVSAADPVCSFDPGTTNLTAPMAQLMIDDTVSDTQSTESRSGTCEPRHEERGDPNTLTLCNAYANHHECSNDGRNRCEWRAANDEAHCILALEYMHEAENNPAMHDHDIDLAKLLVDRSCMLKSNFGSAEQRRPEKQHRGQQQLSFIRKEYYSPVAGLPLASAPSTTIDGGWEGIKPSALAFTQTCDFASLLG